MFINQAQREAHRGVLEARRAARDLAAGNLRWVADLRSRGFWGRLRWLFSGR